MSRPYVVLVRWPVLGDLYESVLTANGAQDGTFHFNRLAGGEYRLIAVAPENKEILEAPYVLERLLSRSENISLATGGFRDVSLKPVDPRR